MNKWMSFSLAFAVLLISLIAIGQERGVVKPQLLLSEIVQGMPKGERQQVRVLTASFQPGDKTMFHTHRYPSDCLCSGRRIHIRNGGARASHGQRWSCDGNATARENDGLQPQQHRAVAAGDLFCE